MSDDEEQGGSADRELIDMLDEFSNDPPSNFFERDTTKESTTVRTMNFVLRTLVEQLREPISTEAEAVTHWIIYKQAGPHRHQKFFSFFRQMSRLLKKFNDISLVKRLNTVLRKTENCGDNLYKLEPTAIRYIGAAFVRRVYLLEKIRSSCVKCSQAAMGMLELSHWVNLSLAMVAVCAQVHVEVVAQLTQMEKAYKTGMKVFKAVDRRFPESLGDLEVVKHLKKESGAFDDRKVDLSAVTKLMKYSELKMEQAQMENEMTMRRNEVLTELLSAEMDLETKPSMQQKKNVKTPVKPKVDLSDLGISVSRDELSSFLNCTAQSSSQLDDSRDDDDLMSPNLFKTPKSSKIGKVSKKSVTKVKKEEVVVQKTGKSEKKKKKKTSFLASTMSLFS